MIYGYIRVSTRIQIKGNSLEDQRIKILSAYPDAIIIEEAYTAVKIKERKKFDNMIQNAKPGDLIVVMKLDRFCRTVLEGLACVNFLLEKNVKIHILNMGLIEDTPIGKMILTNLLAFAEYERTQIIERTQSGKVIARMNPGFREGRPKKFKKKQLEHAAMLKETHSYAQVTEMTGISKTTLYRYMLGTK